MEKEDVGKFQSEDTVSVKVRGVRALWQCRRCSRCSFNIVKLPHFSARANLVILEQQMIQWNE